VAYLSARSQDRHLSRQSAVLSRRKQVSTNGQFRPQCQGPQRDGTKQEKRCAVAKYRDDEAAECRTESGVCTISSGAWVVVGQRHSMRRTLDGRAKA